MGGHPAPRPSEPYFGSCYINPGWEPGSRGDAGTRGRGDTSQVLTRPGPQFPPCILTWNGQAQGDTRAQAQGTGPAGARGGTRTQAHLRHRPCSPGASKSETQK
jgi:hypothetical protein